MGRQTKQYVCTIILIIPMIFIVFPFFWIVITALKPEQYILVPGSIVPPSFTLEHFGKAIMGGIFTYFLNSSIVAASTTIIAISIASTGAYAITRFEFRGRNLMAWWLAVSYLIPSIILSYPLYLFLTQVGLVNSLYGLIASYLSFSIPLGIWFLRGFFLSLSKEVEEAALLDGCNYFQTLVKIILPITLPGIVAIAIVIFMLCWNELLFAITLINSQDLKTLPAALSGFIIVGGGHERLDWGLMTASSAIASIPPMILFIFIRKYLVIGLTSGAVKE